LESEHIFQLDPAVAALGQEFGRDVAAFKEPGANGPKEPIAGDKAQTFVNLRPDTAEALRAFGRGFVADPVNRQGRQGGCLGG
jgi:hypothetical protein